MAQSWIVALQGIATPTRAELARLEREHPKKGSNDDWMHPKDPDATVTKMKDGRTRSPHKAERAVDLETGVVVGVCVQDANSGDTQTMLETLQAALNAWLHHYNTERPDLGHRNQVRRPIETIDLFVRQED